MITYNLRIIGNFELPTSLDATKEILVQVPVDVYSAEKLNKEHNGNYEIRYKGKVDGEAIITQGQEKFVVKDPRKASQKLRWAIMAQAREKGLDEEVYYQETMNKLIQSFYQ